MVVVTRMLHFKQSMVPFTGDIRSSWNMQICIDDIRQICLKCFSFSSDFFTEKWVVSNPSTSTPQPHAFVLSCRWRIRLGTFRLAGHSSTLRVVSPSLVEWIFCYSNVYTLNKILDVPILYWLWRFMQW